MSKKKIYLLVLIVGFIGLSFFFYSSYFQNTNNKAHIFHAVFLTNDQVYFGEVIDDTDKVLTLQNVYYLKASTALPDFNSTATATAKLALVKLGEEIHSPKDQMTINKEHMLFMEEMQPNGTIMDAIRKYEQQKTAH